MAVAGGMIDSIYKISPLMWFRGTWNEPSSWKDLSSIWLDLTLKQELVNNKDRKTNPSDLIFNNSFK